MDKVSSLAEWRENGGVLPDRKSVWEKLREKPTRKLAIDAFCHHCLGWEEGALYPQNTRESIRKCTSPDCPLYMFRPYTEKT